MGIQADGLELIDGLASERAEAAECLVDRLVGELPVHGALRTELTLQRPEDDLATIPHDCRLRPDAAKDLCLHVSDRAGCGYPFRPFQDCGRELRLRAPPELLPQADQSSSPKLRQVFAEDVLSADQALQQVAHT
jgi:hypothetical protein